MSKPYVGITGFVLDSDLEIAKICVACAPKEVRLMAGLLVSAKTLSGEAPHRKRYVPIKDLPSRVSRLSEDGAWPVVHYNSRSDAKALLGELKRIKEIVPSLTGIQLNVANPDGDMLLAFKQEFPDVELILQANAASIGSDPTPEDVLFFAIRYEAVASHVLLDLSAGTGKPINVELARGVQRSWCGPVSLGVAGGLDEERVRALEGMRVSCDAESALRLFSDTLHAGCCFAYVQAAHSIWA